MKTVYYIAIAAFALCLSCSKSIEEPSNGDVSEIQDVSDIVTVKAVISEDISTKTDYAIDWENHTAVFSWKGTEVFSRMGFNGGYINRKEYTGTADDSGETQLTFTGEDVTNDTGFAFYPGVGSFGGMSWGTGSGYLKISIPSTTAYDASNPIKGFIPMMGKLNSAGDLYEFIPLTGVLAIRMTNIPAEATQITISSPGTSGGFAGTFHTHQLPAATLTALQNTYDNGFLFADGETASRSFTFSNLNNANTYYFYFPAPVGDLNGLQIDLADASGVFYTITSSKAVSCVRGQITRLPLITIPTAPSASISGNKNEPTVNFTYNDAAKIKYSLSTSSTGHLSDPTTTTSTSISLNPSTTGTYYLVYQGYKADGTTPMGPEKRVRFLYASTNPSQLNGKYIINNDGSKRWGFEIAAIDPAVDGKNIMLTTYYSNNNDYNNATGECKGVYDPATATVTIPCGQTLATASNTYYLVAIKTYDSSSKTGTYPDNLIFTLTEVDDNAGIKMFGDTSIASKGGLCVATSASAGSFASGGQHFTSDGAGGTLYLYKSN